MFVISPLTLTLILYFHLSVDTGSATLSVGQGRVPWVFTNEQIQMVDARFKRVVLPHNCPAFCTTKQGLFESRTSCWRMASKIQVVFMLPIMFLGTIEALQKPIKNW